MGDLAPEAELTMINNKIFRWFAVIPGALLAAVAALFPWHWLVMIFANFVGKFEGEEHIGLGMLVRVIGPEDVERAGYGFITPFVVISAAARIAPKFKLTTAVVATILLEVPLVIIESRMWLSGRMDVIPTLVANVLTIVAIWAVFTYARSWWEQGEL